MSRVFEDSHLSRNRRNHFLPAQPLFWTTSGLCSSLGSGVAFLLSPPVQETCMVMGAAQGVLGVFFSLSHTHVWKPTTNQVALMVKGFKHGASWVRLHPRLPCLAPQGHLRVGGGVHLSPSSRGSHLNLGFLHIGASSKPCAVGFRAQGDPAGCRDSEEAPLRGCSERSPAWPCLRSLGKTASFPSSTLPCG